MRGIWRIGAVLIAVWIIAFAVVWWTRSIRPTPASLTAYIQGHSLVDQSGDSRAKIIDRVADQLNRLDFDQRQAVRNTGVDRKFFEQMTEEERRRFLDATLPEGFRQLMLALNKMDPAKRQQMVQRALDNLAKADPQANDRVDKAEVQKFMAKGMDSFYQEANADVKLDFAPVIEQLQRLTESRQ